jgi:predicted AlkP superfamily phosphohydrolase/phosphomutase
MSHDKKLIVIGLDCAPPELVFDRFKDDMPNVARLMDTGVYGPLESSIPAITVPAWMSMMTSKDPGQLGFYGFRNRKNYTYDEMFYATSNVIRDKTAWEYLGDAGLESIVVGVPPSFPVRPVEGAMLGCFLTPDSDSDYAYPKELKAEIEKNVGTYIVDVKDFRTDDKDYLRDQIWKLTENRFETVMYLAKNKDWDFLMFVEMGPDRLHHGFWKYFDESQVNYEPNSEYADVIPNYYKYVDVLIGELLDEVGADADVMVVSDHGAKPMAGGFCFNDWLVQKGYLTLNTDVPTEPGKLTNDMIDWSKTKIWGSGGYYGRLFINVAGREPEGVIAKEDYEKFRDELVAELEATTDEHGNNIGTKAFRPEEIYKATNNIPPDLIVYFGDLDWRSIGSIGNPTLWTHENDTGPDDANHAQFGIYIASDYTGKGERREGLHLMDVAPTVLAHFGLEPPPDMLGKVIK